MLFRLMAGLLISLMIASGANADTREKSGMGFTYVEKMENAGSKSAGVRGVLLFKGRPIYASSNSIKTPIGSFTYIESNLPWKPQGWFPIKDIVVPNTPAEITNEALQKGHYSGGLRVGTPADWSYLADSDSWVDPTQLTLKDHRNALLDERDENTKTSTESANCKLKPASGPCKGLIEVYYYDQRSRSCKPFFWGGCQGVVPFKSQEECNRQCQPEARAQ